MGVLGVSSAAKASAYSFKSCLMASTSRGTDFVVGVLVGGA